MIRVAIIDDHYVVRFGLKFMLKLDPGLVFVGESDDANDSGFVGRTKPDILLLDLYLPGMDGLAAFKRIRAAHPEVKVIVLTTSEKEEDIYRSISAGVEGYVLKDSKPSDIVGAIRAVASGGRYFSERVQKAFALRDRVKGLTSREVEMLRLVSKGYSNPDIAGTLGVTAETVKTHLKSIFTKLGVAGRAEAVSVAIARGILSLAIAVLPILSSNAAERTSDMRDFSGTVTWVDPWWGFCVQEDDVAFFVEGRTYGELDVGMRVDVSGTPRFRGRSGELRRAGFRIRGDGVLPPPRTTTIRDLFSSIRRDEAGMSDLYGLRIELVGTMIHADDSRIGVSPIVLGDASGTVTVRLAGSLPNEIAAVRDGHPTVRVRGACLMQFPDEDDVLFDRGPQVEILVPGPEDIDIVEDEVWQDILARRHARRLMMGLVIAVCGVLVYLIVKLALSRSKVRRLEAVNAERRRMSADLHDTIEQHFAGIGLVLNTALAMTDNPPPVISDAIAQATGILARAKAEMREAVWDLRGDSPMGDDPAGTIRRIARSVNAGGAVRVRCELSALPPRLENRTMVSLVFIVQEAIANAIKHGGAANVIIGADRIKTGWMLRIANDGTPFDPNTVLDAATGHFGLVGIRERAKRGGMSVSWLIDERWTVLQLSSVVSAVTGKRR